MPDVPAPGGDLEETLARFFAAGPAGAVRVLEVACGEGAPTRLLQRVLSAHHPAAVRVSLDIDAEKVAVARGRGAGLPGGPGGWLCADLLTLPLPSASVDYVVAFNIFHGIDRRRFGMEMHRVLRPAGRALLYDRVPQLLPVPRLALLLGREELGALGRLPEKVRGEGAGQGGSASAGSVRERQPHEIR